MHADARIPRRKSRRVSDSKARRDLRAARRVVNVFLVFAYVTAPHALWSCFNFESHRASRPPPDCSLTRQSETAGRDLGVWVRVF